jgi:hypothetical protein
MTRNEIAAIPTPAPMGARHKPVPYGDFIDLTQDALDHVGLAVRDEQYGALKDGKRFFGLLEVAPKFADADERFGLMVGLRASHDQSFARGLVVGSRVFVCDNLAFSGEISINTKQTLNITDRLPGMVYNAVETIPGHFEVQHKRFDRYREVELAPKDGDHALIEMVRRDVLSGSALGKALEEWDHPTYEEHAEDGMSVWRLMQAVTHALKAPVDPETKLPTRPAAPMAMEKTVRMTRFLDEVADFKLAA